MHDGPVPAAQVVEPCRVTVADDDGAAGAGLVVVLARDLDAEVSGERVAGQEASGGGLPIIVLLGLGFLLVEEPAAEGVAGEAVGGRSEAAAVSVGEALVDAVAEVDPWRRRQQRRGEAPAAANCSEAEAVVD